MKLHLGLKAKVCMALFLLGSSFSVAQEVEVDDPFASEELQVEESFQDNKPLSEQDPLSIQDPEKQNQQQTEKDLDLESDLEEEIQMANPDENVAPNPSENLSEPNEESFVKEEAPVEIERTQGLVAVPEAGLVEYESPDDYTLSYSQRRKTHGAYVSIDYEPTYFSNFVSDGLSYKDIFGESEIPMIRLSVDYKYNTRIGALSIGGFYSMGSLGGSYEGADQKLSLNRVGGTVRFALDQLTSEPYFVPYAGVVGYQATLKQELADSGKSYNYPFTATWIAGVMIQLDWLDLDSAIESRKAGIENTFLDIFATQYSAVTDEALANTQTEVLLGGGLRMEF